MITPQPPSQRGEWDQTTAPPLHPISGISSSTDFLVKPFLPPCCGGGWRPKFPVGGLPDLTQTLTISATNPYSRGFHPPQRIVEGIGIIKQRPQFQRAPSPSVSDGTGPPNGEGPARGRTGRRAGRRPREGQGTPAHQLRRRRRVTRPGSTAGLGGSPSDVRPADGHFGWSACLGLKCLQGLSPIVW